MLKTEKEEEICKKYSQMGPDGKVQCKKCPLNLAVRVGEPLACKATYTYNPSTHEWECDYA